MEQDTKECGGEINIYSLWKVIAKRKRLIIGLVLAAVIATVMANSFMPRIYRGNAVISIWQNDASMMTAKDVIPPKETISAKEIAEIIGNVDQEKRKYLLPKMSASVTDIKLRTMKESKDKLLVIIDAKNIDDIPKALTELLDYINNFSIVKSTMKEEREKLLNRHAELSEIIRSSSDLVSAYNRQLKAGTLAMVGFNPLDLDKKIADIKLEKLMVEQSLQRLQNGGLATASQPFVSNNPVKPKKILNIVSGGAAGFIIGYFLALLFEYLEKNRGIA